MQITEFVNATGTTTFFGNLQFPKDFEVGEAILFGNTSKVKQITVHIESGVYEEDYPIKVPANVTIKGDDYRRVIVKPKDRLSQSHWAGMYLYRDMEFDGLATAVTGTPFFNQMNIKQGFFGYHYLVDADKPLAIGPTITNAGNFTKAAEIVRLNKGFIQEEIKLIGLMQINQNINLR